MTNRDAPIIVELDNASAAASVASRCFLPLKDQAARLDTQIVEHATQALASQERGEIRVLVVGDLHDSTHVERIRRALEANSVDGAHISVLAGAPRTRCRTLVVDDAFLVQRQLAEAIKAIEVPRLELYAPEAENKPWYRQHAQRGRRRAY
ncbi:MULTISPECIES: hypothetical protein [unclassified Variovorax]|uniref:hypothetical protein n=1 Tax=unclassified Variovorax TaxID=663243 RepID=UPI001319349B|nr:MULTISPECIES: hypothetical protein [unclassified Variovorax]VTU43268.1 hypothetical protein SRS16P1_00482 [Variovorax sp. SRS16]VTU43291.1 hypothetical protein E5P1_00479 [Variovorax sp. PBL-E5]VTU43331.1 hypothetical protein H6P1_00424 [Variovorax sp. PBL-H6]